jgi:hypothetical protein
MSQETKPKLHKFLFVLYYALVAINFIVPLTLVAVSAEALSRVDGLHWTVRWTVWLTFVFSIVEFMSQLHRTVKQHKGK